MRGVQVGKVVSIDNRPDGTAALHLAMDPGQMHLIPANVTANIASSTIVRLEVRRTRPAAVSVGQCGYSARSGRRRRARHGRDQHRLSEQLVNVLDKIDPAKLNETLGASARRSTAAARRSVDAVGLRPPAGQTGPEPAQSQTRDAGVCRRSPMPAPTPPEPDENGGQRGQHQQHAGLRGDRTRRGAGQRDRPGGRRQQVLGGNRQALAEVTHLLVPTTELLDRYNDHVRCAIGGIARRSPGPPAAGPGVLVSTSFVMGIERYRYPQDLPKVNARAATCESQKLPKIPPEWFPPFVSADVGRRSVQYGNQGILLNSAGLKEWLFGQTDGPPRNVLQYGQPG